jgi:hypothetical protein
MRDIPQAWRENATAKAHLQEMKENSKDLPF